MGKNVEDTDILIPHLEKEKLKRKILMTKPLPCPFCGKKPKVFPLPNHSGGNCWGQVCCENIRCAANPIVADGEMVSDDRGSNAYKGAAILRWNKRAK